MPPADSRPPLLQLGIVLLVVHDLLVLALCGIGGVLGGLAILLAAADAATSSEAALFVGGGILLVLAVVLVASLAALSLVVCALAWRGGRSQVRVLVGVALVSCVLLVPNPLGILAAVFCVLGGLQHLDETRPDPKIAPAPASSEDPEGDADPPPE